MMIPSFPMHNNQAPSGSGYQKQTVNHEGQLFSTLGEIKPNHQFFAEWTQILICYAKKKKYISFSRDIPRSTGDQKYLTG